MDKHSEVEAKFNATALSPARIFSYLNEEGGRYKIESYIDVAGWDTYYTQGDRTVRHRCDGKRMRSVLTVKQRKSADSIADRHEVDLPLGDEVPSKDVVAFLMLTGWETLFTIEKRSFIWKLRPWYSNSIEVCLALYDVTDPWAYAEHDCGTYRFLEIEVEKDSECSQEQANKILVQWVAELREAFKLEAPLNQSLLEMFRPGGIIQQEAKMRLQADAPQG